MATVHELLIPVVNGFAYGLVLFTVAAGLSLAFGVADVLNLAHGTTYLAGGYVGAVLSDGSWGGLLLGAAAGAAVGLGAGGVLAAAVRPLRARGHLPQAMLTFGIALIGGYLLIEIFGAREQRATLPAVLDGTVPLWGKTYSLYRLCFIAVAAVLVVGGWIILSRTTVGARIRACVDDPGMVSSLGTNPHSVMSGVLMAAGLLAGLGGVLGAPIIGLGPGTANHMLLLSLIIVVLGRPGSWVGALVASLFVGQVQNLGVRLFPEATAYLLFAAMAVVLVSRRHRVFGTAAAS